MRFITSILALALVLLSTPLIEAQEPDQTFERTELPIKTSKGRSALSIPDRTDAGNWDGTWIYVNRDYNFALWLVENEDGTIGKIRFKGNGNLVEDFETDWKGHAEYTVQNHLAQFDFTLKETDPDFMTASWKWDLDFRGSARRETGEIDIYRAGDGRQIVMHFKDFERVIESAGRTKRVAMPQVWTFRKMSKRLALWEELPF